MKLQKSNSLLLLAAVLSCLMLASAAISEKDDKTETDIIFDEPDDMQYDIKSLGKIIADVVKASPSKLLSNMKLSLPLPNLVPSRKQGFEEVKSFDEDGVMEYIKNLGSYAWEKINDAWSYVTKLFGSKSEEEEKLKGTLERMQEQLKTLEKLCRKILPLHKNEKNEKGSKLKNFCKNMEESFIKPYKL